ncbi:hypothetical protein [Spirosoma arcticum]
MDEQPSHAKRKHYDSQTYTRLLDELTQRMDEVPKLKPNRDAWDIEGDWAATGVIHFVDAAHQPLFEPIQHFDCRTIKLVNLHRPAVRITFYRKHRYWLLKDKDLPMAEKMAQIQTYLDELTVKAQQVRAQLTTTTSPQLALYQQQIAVWNQILANPQYYEMALSNYSRQHFYVTINYKYRLPSGNYANEQEHLLNTQRDRLGNITQVRSNIVFVDPLEILREHPYQNREVEAYLNGFPIQSPLGRHTLYARMRAETEAFRLVD